MGLRRVSLANRQPATEWLGVLGRALPCSPHARPDGRAPSSLDSDAPARGMGATYAYGFGVHAFLSAALASLRTVSSCVVSAISSSDRLACTLSSSVEFRFSVATYSYMTTWRFASITRISSVDSSRHSGEQNREKGSPSRYWRLQR